MRQCRSWMMVMSLLTAGAMAAADDRPWTRHVIDSSSRGADGVRLGDVNGDGLLDIVTGWEEGGKIRVYLNPGPAKSKETWPAVTVGNVASPEDALLVDLDGDGAMDVVSSCEGKHRTMFVHWGPKNRGALLDEKAWVTQAIPATQGEQMWMYALPMQVDGRHGVDLIVGSKGEGAAIGWLEAPPDARDVAAWKYHRLYDAGWIMSLEPVDVDGDGDTDIIATDRKGAKPGALWLENPGPEAAGRGEKWREHRIGGDGQELLFMTVADVDGDGQVDVVAGGRSDVTRIFRRATRQPVSWQTIELQNPWGVKGGKGLAVGDIDGDGRVDLVQSTELYAFKENAGKPPVWWRSLPRGGDGAGEGHAIAATGTKFDLVQLIDLDGDGDLDVLTCEERANLGVIWFENPSRLRK